MAATERVWRFFCEEDWQARATARCCSGRCTRGSCANAGSARSELAGRHGCVVRVGLALARRGANLAGSLRRRLARRRRGACLAPGASSSSPANPSAAHVRGSTPEAGRRAPGSPREARCPSVQVAAHGLGVAASSHTYGRGTPAPEAGAVVPDVETRAAVTRTFGNAVGRRREDRAFEAAVARLEHRLDPTKTRRRRCRTCRPRGGAQPEHVDDEQDDHDDVHELVRVKINRVLTPARTRADAPPPSSSDGGPARSS